jgi:hypothetical protein
MAWVRALRCNTVYITRYRSMHVPVSIRTSYFMADKKGLVDSGATDNFMHPAFAKRMGLGLQELPNPKKIFNIDNTSNKSCYGWLAVVSDVDVEGFALNVDKRMEDLPCYNEASTTERCWDRGGRDAHKGMNALSKCRGVY